MEVQLNMAGMLYLVSAACDGGNINNHVVKIDTDYDTHSHASIRGRITSRCTFCR